MARRQLLFDDAIHATRAAILARRRAIPTVQVEAARLANDDRAGAQMLRRALEVPARQIAENSGVDGGVVVETMRTGTGALRFDAAAGHCVDLVEAGIIDPAKVVRVVLENAASVATCCC
jgi:chaperonin GroEL